VRLVQTAVGVKQLRMGLLSREGTPTHAPLGGAAAPSLPALLADALVAPDTPAIPLASRALWLEMAAALDKAATSDKQTKALLSADADWAAVAARLTPLREVALPDNPGLQWKCGAPPARGAGQGMGGEMGELLRLLQSMPTPSG